MKSPQVFSAAPCVHPWDFYEPNLPRLKELIDRLRNLLSDWYDDILENIDWGANDSMFFTYDTPYLNDAKKMDREDRLRLFHQIFDPPCVISYSKRKAILTSIFDERVWSEMRDMFLERGEVVEKEIWRKVRQDFVSVRGLGHNRILSFRDAVAFLKEIKKPINPRTVKFVSYPTVTRLINSLKSRM